MNFSPVLELTVLFDNHCVYAMPSLVEIISFPHLPALLSSGHTTRPSSQVTSKTVVIGLTQNANTIAFFMWN